LGAERLQDLLAEKRLRAFVADGDGGHEGRLVRVKEDAAREGRRHARGLGTYGGRGVDADAAFAGYLRERGREIERRAWHRHVAAPRAIPPDTPRGHDVVAAGFAADANPRAARGGDDFRDEVPKRRPQPGAAPH